LSCKEKVVEVFLLAGLLEGEDALYDNKDDNSDREDINLGSVVGLALLNFWGHIGHRTSVALELVNALVASEAEVGDLQVELFVNEDVLELQVSMNASETVHVVEGSNELRHKEPAGVLAHGAHGLAQVEEEAT